MAEQQWTIDFVRSAFYLDNRGNPVNGYEVGITLPRFGDSYTLNLPDDDPDTIADAAQERYDRRVRLEEMSGGG